MWRQRLWNVDIALETSWCPVRYWKLEHYERAGSITCCWHSCFLRGQAIGCIAIEYAGWIVLIYLTRNDINNLCYLIVEIWQKWIHFLWQYIRKFSTRRVKRENSAISSVIFVLRWPSGMYMPSRIGEMLLPLISQCIPSLFKLPICVTHGIDNRINGWVFGILNLANSFCCFQITNLGLSCEAEYLEMHMAHGILYLVYKSDFYLWPVSTVGLGGGCLANVCHGETLWST